MEQSAVTSMPSDGGVWVRAEINYICNPPAKGEPYLTFVTEDEAQSTMITRPGVSMPIFDIRGAETSLDGEGFELVSHRSKVADFDQIEENAEIDQLYIDEMTELLKKVTGAAVVIMLGGGKKRYGPSARTKLAGLLNALPALYPHGDTTEASALGQAQMLAGFVPGLELDKVKRWALYNMWRPITPPPHDYPLAVCEARTIGPGDSVTVIAETETRTTGTIIHDTRGYLHSDRHRWWSVRDMTPAEVLIFKTHDTEPANAHQVAHTAFANPSCPDGAPARGSVEMRAFAAFQ